jgi:hypothetical protein
MEGSTPTELRSRRKKHTSTEPKAFRKFMAGFSEFLFIVFALILLGVIAVGIYATDYLTGVLRELETNDYSAPQERVAEYESYFERQTQQGYQVVPSEPMLREGDIYYLWTVTPPYSSDNVVYRWKISLETNEVTPLTKAAEQLDRELGFS